MTTRVLPKVPEFPPVELDLSNEDIPIVRWEDGSYRFKGTRVLLYLVAEGLASGMSAADLVDCLPSLDQADVERVAEFYFRRKPEVDEFVRIIEEQGEEVMTAVLERQRLMGAPGWPKK
jgi:uncharacterized protein (DUF433 family)